MYHQIHNIIASPMSIPPNAPPNTCIFKFVFLMSDFYNKESYILLLFYTKKVKSDGAIQNHGNKRAVSILT